MRQVLSRQFVRFCGVGLINTLASLAVIFAGKALLGLGDLTANLGGYAIGLTISFFANRRWTFDHRGQLGSTAGRFLMAFAIAYGTNLATVFGLIHLAGVDSYLAQAAGMPPYTLVFFLISRHFVFSDAAAAGPPVASPGWPAAARQATALLTLLLLAVAGYRGGALLLAEPMLAVANNYDMVRIHACIKAYPIRAPGIHPFSPSVDAPLSRYQFRYDLEADCFFSTEAVLARLARPLFRAEAARSSDGSFSVRWVGLVKFALFFTAAAAFSLAWLRRGQPGAALANALVVAVVLVDPGITLYLNGFYAEYGTVLFAYGTLAGAALMLSAGRPPGWGNLLLLGLCCLALVCTKIQHAGLGVLVALFVALPILFRVRIDRRTCLALALGGAVGLGIQAVHMQKPDNQTMRLANKTSAVLMSLLPLSADRERTVAHLGLPAHCARHAGINWYLPPVSENAANHPCREVGEVSNGRLFGLAFTEPGLFFRFLGTSLAHSRPWIPTTYGGQPLLGVVEGAPRGTPLPEGWFSWSRILDRLPLGLIQGLVVGPAIIVGLLLLLGRLKQPALAAMLTTLALAPYPVAAVVLLGNGYADPTKQMHLLYVCVLSFWVLALAALAREILPFAARWRHRAVRAWAGRPA